MLVANMRVANMRAANMRAAGLRAAGQQVASAAAPGREAWFAVARAQSGQALQAVAQKITPRQRFDDLVLPQDSLAQLHEMAARVTSGELVLERWGFGKRMSLGRGVTALFSGPPGTGKTMAAEVVAGALGLDLYRIDLAQVVSKYIGETEKNLNAVFSAAEDSNAILFFDEADALFGRRSEVQDAHDRYANIEVAYLLQKMEQYEGAAILATNLRQNLDEAFMRRLSFVINFPFPDESSRQRIWQGIWPEETPVDSQLDFARLARRFRLSGGNIRNIALAAAYLAAQDGGLVTNEHLLLAVRREYQKMGKIYPEVEQVEAV
jgi:SpoVK/Ycf46/Vps4 family AAA+-type ATPase